MKPSWDPSSIGAKNVDDKKKVRVWIRMETTVSGKNKLGQVMGIRSIRKVKTANTLREVKVYELTRQQNWAEWKIY